MNTLELIGRKKELFHSDIKKFEEELKEKNKKFKIFGHWRCWFDWAGSLPSNI